MSGASGLLVAAVVVAAAACAPRDLDPGEGPITGGLPESLVALAGPDARLIVGRDGGAMINGGDGRAHQFAIDPGALVATAATVKMSVCSVELKRLATTSRTADAEEITVDDAVDDCDGFDFGTMLDRLAAQQAPSTKIAVGSNTAIIVGTPSDGISYFYDADRVRLLRAARKLYIPACVVIPEDIALPTFPEGYTSGLSFREALARCGL